MKSETNIHDAAKIIGHITSYIEDLIMDRRDAGRNLLAAQSALNALLSDKEYADDRSEKRRDLAGGLHGEGGPVSGAVQGRDDSPTVGVGSTCGCGRGNTGTHCFTDPRTDCPSWDITKPITGYLRNLTLAQQSQDQRT